MTVKNPEEAGALRRVEELEAELETARAESEKGAIVKARFLANMSHEFRTPLNAILGFAELLASDLNQALGAERHREYVAAIIDSGWRLLTTLDDILEMTKIEGGKVELSEREIPVSDLIASSVQLVRAAADKARLRIDIEITDDRVLIVDERAMRRVLVNLLLNAIKFNHPGGHVRLAACTDRGGSLAIRITDTGIGIEEAEIPKLLEPFTQASDDLARRYEGGGLGLPIAKGLLEMHDGKLEIESKPDFGTTVTIVFPPYRIVGQKLADDDLTVLDLSGDTTTSFDECLVLEFCDRTVSVFAGSGNCVLGRNREKPNEVKCDIVVYDQRVSRPHARVRYEGDGFYLFDQSRHGTHVVRDDGTRVYARPDTPIRLSDDGEIYLGVAPEEPGAQPIRYHLASQALQAQGEQQ
jgi:nitrogen-specific signal transduction histidine kinase